jgi:hypothetical protein
VLVDANILLYAVDTDFARFEEIAWINPTVGR